MPCFPCIFSPRLHLLPRDINHMWHAGRQVFRGWSFLQSRDKQTDRCQTTAHPLSAICIQWFMLLLFIYFACGFNTIISKLMAIIQIREITGKKSPVSPKNLPAPQFFCTTVNIGGAFLSARAPVFLHHCEQCGAFVGGMVQCSDDDDELWESGRQRNRGWRTATEPSWTQGRLEISYFFLPVFVCFATRLSANALLFRMSRSSIHPVRYFYNDISWTAWTVLMITDREYSLAPTDDLIRFWRSKVKVTAGLSMLWCCGDGMQSIFQLYWADCCHDWQQEGI